MQKPEIMLPKVLLFNPYFNFKKTGAISRIEALTDLLRKELVVQSKFYKVSPKFLVYPFGFIYGGYLFFKERNTLIITEFILLPLLFPKIILLIHDNKNFNKKTRRSWLKSKIYFAALKRVKNVIFVNPIVEKEFERKYRTISKSKYHVLKNPVKNIFLKLPYDNQNFKKEFDFIYISSFVAHKNHKNLIDSCPPDSVLALVGSDLGYKKEVIDFAKKSKKNILIFENIDDEELIILMKKTKVGVFPSCFEGFGIPILEYAALNMPIVTSNLQEFTSFKNLIDYQFDPFNIQEMNKTLNKALRDFEKFKLKDKRSEVLKFNESVKEEAIRIFSEISKYNNR